ncbi:hypothetical protein WICPIJ_010079 [Wickerhamomyces pijperi]|uniref:Uncharacterized protein n=1 Tax=Wickerhamomyces pijperi TaxID=599730 RepID=A0A9P8PHK7_WICPI|nr:hypothetical protein WICPIJ_010079 [Wickerhamomyces pijperi]
MWPFLVDLEDLEIECTSVSSRSKINVFFGVLIGNTNLGNGSLAAFVSTLDIGDLSSSDVGVMVCLASSPSSSSISRITEDVRLLSIPRVPVVAGLSSIGLLFESSSTSPSSPSSSSVGSLCFGCEPFLSNSVKGKVKTYQKKRSGLMSMRCGTNQIIDASLRMKEGLEVVDVVDLPSVSSSPKAIDGSGKFCNSEMFSLSFVWMVIGFIRREGSVRSVMLLSLLGFVVGIVL